MKIKLPRLQHARSSLQQLLGLQSLPLFLPRLLLWFSVPSVESYGEPPACDRAAVKWSVEQDFTDSRRRLLLDCQHHLLLCILELENCPRLELTVSLFCHVRWVQSITFCLIRSGSSGRSHFPPPCPVFPLMSPPPSFTVTVSPSSSFPSRRVSSLPPRRVRRARRRAPICRGDWFMALTVDERSCLQVLVGESLVKNRDGK